MDINCKASEFLKGLLGPLCDSGPIPFSVCSGTPWKSSDDPAWDKIEVLISLNDKSWKSINNSKICNNVFDIISQDNGIATKSYSIKWCKCENTN